MFGRKNSAGGNMGNESAPRSPAPVLGRHVDSICLSEHPYIEPFSDFWRREGCTEHLVQWPHFKDQETDAQGNWGSDLLRRCIQLTENLGLQFSFTILRQVYAHWLFLNHLVKSFQMEGQPIDALRSPQCPNQATPCPNLTHTIPFKPSPTFDPSDFF